jgi:pimeloyl-ACP methyl ester carboxylesterase
MAWLVRDGERLFHAVKGEGRPMVMVHGWTCNHTFSAPVSDHFSRSCKVVSVDLSGHGKSDAPEREYSVYRFADEVAWVMDQLELGLAVLVGHSMGGMVVTELAATRPDLAAAVVRIDSGSTVRTDAVVQRWRQLIAGMKSDRYQTIIRDFIAGMFEPFEDPATRSYIELEMLKTPKHVTMSAFEGINRWDAVASASKIAMPVLNISRDLRRFNDIREHIPHAENAETVGSGHFMELMVPQQVIAMIERFVEVHGLR